MQYEEVAMKRVRVALAFLVTLLGVGTATAQRLVWLGMLEGIKARGRDVGFHPASMCSAWR